MKITRAQFEDIHKAIEEMSSASLRLVESGVVSSIDTKQLLLMALEFGDVYVEKEEIADASVP